MPTNVLLDTATSNLVTLLLGISILIFVAWFLDSAISRRRNLRISADTGLVLARGIDKIIAILNEQSKQSYTPFKPNDTQEKLKWANGVIANTIGANPSLMLFPTPSSNETAPFFLAGEDSAGQRYLISDMAPEAVKRLPIPKDRLAVQNRNPLLPIPRGTQTYRMSAANCGPHFPLAINELWKSELHKDLVMNEMYLFVIPPVAKKN